MNTIEALDKTQNERLNAIESVNAQQTTDINNQADKDTELEGKIDSNKSAIDKNADNSVPSVKAVADYFGSNISGAMDFAVAKDSSASTVSISNETNGLCAVRVTKMSDGTTQYQSNISLGFLTNKKTTFTFNIETLANYMVEAWFYNSGTNKLVPTAVKFI